MIYFCWVQENEGFDPSVHLRHDEDIFDLKIIEKEGYPACATIVIKTPADPTWENKTWALISYDDGQKAVCLFRGKRQPHAHHRLPMTTLEFTVTEEVDEKRLGQEAAKTLQDVLCQAPYYDPLVTPDPLDYKEVLAGHCATLYWDRLTAQPRLSHLTEGVRTVDITHGYDANSLQISLEPAIGAVDITLNAQWIQTLQGIFDLFPYIREKFPGNVLATYTGHSLKRSWPKTGVMFKNSGYRVAYSELEESAPPYEAPGQHVNATLTVMGPSDNPLQDTREKKVAQCTWFRGKLLLSWRLNQKRDEYLRCQVSSCLQPVAAFTAALNIRLSKVIQKDDIPLWSPQQDYTSGTLVQYHGKVFTAIQGHRSSLIFEADQSRWEENPEETALLFQNLQSSFFTTERGYQVFNHALMRAKAMLLRGARCLKISLKGPLQTLATLTTDDRIVLHDTRFPRGQVRGKIISYTLAATAQKAEVSLVIACCPGDKSPLQPASSQPTYAEGYCEPTYQVHRYQAQMLPGIAYYRYDAQVPNDTYAPLKPFLNSSLPVKVRVHNPAPVQEAYLRNPRSDLRKPALQALETRITVQLQKLKGYDALTHWIYPEIPTPFIPPQDVLIQE